MPIPEMPQPLDKVVAFTIAADSYCRLTEEHQKMDRLEFLRLMSITLPELYARAVGLPQDTSKEGPDLPRIPHGEWETMFQSLLRMVGAEDQYWTCFNPYLEDEIVSGSLSDDLADIYRDIKPGLIAFHSGNSAQRNSAVWEWQFTMTTHWGHHATGAIRALHQLRSEYRLREY